MLADGAEVLEIVLAKPRGFCAGVERAIAIVELALEKFGAPLYVRHEVVHNQWVVEDFRARGVVFIEDLAEIPDGSLVIFSAHGVSPGVFSEAERRGLLFFDATCPLVTKVHLEVVRHSKADRECILIGHAGHPEVEGTLGHYCSTIGAIYLVENRSGVESLVVRDPDNLAFVTQTTLSVEETRDIIAALEARFPRITGPKRDDICYATQNRQDAVVLLAKEVDLVLVLGSPNSSNSNRLQELAVKLGVEAYLISDAFAIQEKWLTGKRRIGITAGASAPEHLVQGVVAHLVHRSKGAQIRELAGIEENMIFPIPKVLRVVE